MLKPIRGIIPAVNLWTGYNLIRKMIRAIRVKWRGSAIILKRRNWRFVAKPSPVPWTDLVGQVHALGFEGT